MKHLCLNVKCCMFKYVALFDFPPLTFLLNHCVKNNLNFTNKCPNSNHGGPDWALPTLKTEVDGLDIFDTTSTRRWIGQTEWSSHGYYRCARVTATPPR